MANTSTKLQDWIADQYPDLESLKDNQPPTDHAVGTMAAVGAKTIYINDGTNWVHVSSGQLAADYQFSVPTSNQNLPGTNGVPFDVKLASNTITGDMFNVNGAGTIATATLTNFPTGCVACVSLKVELSSVTSANSSLELISSRHGKVDIRTSNQGIHNITGRRDTGFLATLPSSHVYKGDTFSARFVDAGTNGGDAYLTQINFSIRAITAL